MGQETLHYLRLLVPGLLLVLAAVTVLAPDSNPIERFKDLEFELKGAWGGAIVVAGVLYHVFGLREHIGGLDWAEVRNNIQQRLLDITKVALSPQQADYLRSDRKLLDVFYLLVDGHASQAVRQARVRFNGLLVSSVCDCAAVAVVAAALHLLLGYIRHHGHHLMWALLMGLIFFACRFIIEPRVMAKHMELSNEQIGFIATFQRADLDDAIRAALARPP
jgi:hypothetical protein